jgi:TPR repeat protein
VQAAVVAQNLHLQPVEREAMNLQLLFILSLLWLAACTTTDDIEKLRKAAMKGDARSQYIIGAMYENGTWFKKDYTEARRWFLLASEQGYAQAEYELGLMHQFGLGVRQDRQEAETRFRKACAGGFRPACDALRRMNDRKE